MKKNPRDKPNHNKTASTSFLDAQTHDICLCKYLSKYCRR